MNILVLYTSFSLKDRKTVADSLFCFERYMGNHQFYYLDVRQPEDIPPGLGENPFDGVIMHYTLFANRYVPQTWQPLYQALHSLLAKMEAYKVMIPQDEYNVTGELRRFARECGVGHIFTCASERDYDILYPPQTRGVASCSTVYTGYVDEHTLQLVNRLGKSGRKRAVDIGYRARALPYWLGRHGQLKTQLAEQFNKRLPDYPTLHTDIKTTGRQEQNTLHGDDWLKFLLNCRTMLGCLGGSGLMDVDGSIAKAVDAYCAENPGASFDEVEAACFPGQDGKLHLYALSPRHFECAMTKTCQLLVEGDYFGVFEPGVHYIEIKKDFSNVDEVLRQVQDTGLCAQIAQRCYDDVVAKPGPQNPNTYAWYANRVVSLIQARAEKPAQTLDGERWWQLAKSLRRQNRVGMQRMAREKRREAGRVRFYTFFDSHPRLTGLLKRIKGLAGGDT